MLFTIQIYFINIFLQIKRHSTIYAYVSSRLISRLIYNEHILNANFARSHKWKASLRAIASFFTAKFLFANDEIIMGSEYLPVEKRTEFA